MSREGLRRANERWSEHTLAGRVGAGPRRCAGRVFEHSASARRELTCG